MKMAMKDGQILIREADNVQFTIIKSWGKMKWSRQTQTLSGPADIELLNRLAGLVNLPPSIEAERKKLNEVMAAVDRERMNPKPEPLIPPPVKVSPFTHQVRGYNMALMTFGLVDPPKPGGRLEQDGARFGAPQSKRKSQEGGKNQWQKRIKASVCFLKWDAERR